jgi:hypothetical protein
MVLILSMTEVSHPTTCSRLNLPIFCLSRNLEAKAGTWPVDVEARISRLINNS